MEEKEKGTWGGARKGAGRKPLGRKYTGFHLTPEEKVYLKYRLEEYRLGLNKQRSTLRMATALDELYVNDQNQYAAKVGPFIYAVKRVGFALNKEKEQELYYYATKELDSLEGFVLCDINGEKFVFIFNEEKAPSIE